MRGFLCIIIFSFLLSCSYHVDKTGGANQSQSDAALGTQPISWRLMQTSVLKSCLQCHSGSKQPLLFSYSDMVQNISGVWAEVSSGTMPPPSSGISRLSTCRTAILRKWIDLGTPENSSVMVSSLPECPSHGGDGGDLPINQMPLNYQTLRTKILEPRCLHCHNVNDTTDAGAILFSPYSQLMQGARKWSSPAKDSKVVHLSRTTNLDDRMPPPEDGDALQEDEIQFIERWIDAGKPEF
jgi:hypothetical protein